MNPVLEVFPLGMPWATMDPFLFCVHHLDAYPAGNEQQGPAASLAGRNLGQDFAGVDGWNMYHGQVVPGFPAHPHRGFETVTVVRAGWVDHADSLGAAARYGPGDVQWLTAGAGISHAEMMPLRDPERPNPLELFQIWLNLPRERKLVPPHFQLLWHDTVPTVIATDAAGRPTEIRVVAGAMGEQQPPAPPPDSWAADHAHDVAIWTLRMAPGATWTLPAADPASNRVLYSYEGLGLTVAGTPIPARHGVRVQADAELELIAGPEGASLLMLQGKPIGEPVVQHGPFVMTTPAEIMAAFAEYRATGFGGWPWPVDDPVQPREVGRFARHPDGRMERPEA